jgi:hypothetical protein
MKKRSYIAIAAVIAATTLGIGLTTVPAHAQAATYELKDDNGGSSLCMNRSGQGTSNGTPVIAYNCGQVNNDFYFAQLTQACGSGTVTQTCPFTDGSGLNLAYYGDDIVVEYAYNENKCVGGNTSNDASAKLEPCPSNSGSGGGWSTIGVLAYSRGNAPPYYVIVNRNWSDKLYAAGGGGVGCYGSDCSLIVGAFYGYRNPLTLNIADSQVQQSHPQNAAYYDVWGEVSY